MAFERRCCTGHYLAAMSDGGRWRQQTGCVVGVFDLHPIGKVWSLKRRDGSSTDVNIISAQGMGDGVNGVFSFCFENLLSPDISLDDA